MHTLTSLFADRGRGDVSGGRRSPRLWVWLMESGHREVNSTSHCNKSNYKGMVGGLGELLIMPLRKRSVNQVKRSVNQVKTRWNVPVFTHVPVWHAVSFCRAFI